MNICITDSLFCIPETILYTWNSIVNQLCFNKNQKIKIKKNISVEYSVPCPNRHVRAQVWNLSQFNLSCSRLWIGLHLAWKHICPFIIWFPIEQTFFLISLPAERCMFVIICLRCLMFEQKLVKKVTISQWLLVKLFIYDFENVLYIHTQFLSFFLSFFFLHIETYLLVYVTSEIFLRAVY